MKFNFEEVNRLIKTRRSVFPTDYTSERIDDSIIHQMLENANWAPNHRFTEPWRFLVFTGEGLKKLGKIQSDIYKKVTKADGTFTEKKYLNLLEKPMSASHIIVISMHRDPGKSVPEVEEIAAVSCAVQNMYLTATAYGVGCYWGTGGVTYFEESKEYFGLGPDDRLMGFLYVGFPKRWPDAPKRGKIIDKTKWYK